MAATAAFAQLLRDVYFQGGLQRSAGHSTGAAGMRDLLSIKELVKILKSKDQSARVQFLVVDAEGSIVCCGLKGATGNLAKITKLFSSGGRPE